VAHEQRRLAAIVAIDVVGYSRLMGQNESGTHALLKTHLTERVMPSFGRHGGRVVKSTGDGVLAEFGSTVSALSALIELQQAMANANRDEPETDRIVFRSGVHLGEVIVEDNDLYGDAVNIAARLQGEAPPGGILISRAVREAVEGRLKAKLHALGELSLKNIERPIRAFRVEWDAADWKTMGTDVPKPAITAEPTTSTLALPDKPSIAVLPFQNMSGDPEQEYFTDGITEDIITELSRFHSLFVIARNSSFFYKGKSFDIRQIGRELGVRYVLEGSIRKAANRIRVTGQLIDTLSGNQIWAERYDRVLEDIFAVQEEVTRAIVSEIAPQIEAVEHSKAVRRRPDSLSAYEIALRAYAHAREGRDKADRTIFDQSIREAKEALAIDPGSVLALHAIILAHSNALYTELAADREHVLREATWAAAQAIELDGTNALSYAQRGIIVFLSGQLDRYPDALADARRAYELNPNDAFVLRLLGTLESATGQHERAIEHGQQVLRLNPREPRNHMAYNFMAYASFGAKHYVEGIDWASRALNDVSRYPLAHHNLAVCLVGAGEVDKAKAAFDVGQELAPEYFKRRLEGTSSYARSEDRKRVTTFLRIAAGLEDPSAADALR
jgi:TolB-like protein/class 3 adenylate cyclase